MGDFGPTSTDGNYELVGKLRFMVYLPRKHVPTQNEDVGGQRVPLSNSSR